MGSGDVDLGRKAQCNDHQDGFGPVRCALMPRLAAGRAVRRCGMISRRPARPALLVVARAQRAAERRSSDRQLRPDPGRGPFEVRVATGGSPRRGVGRSRARSRRSTCGSTATRWSCGDRHRRWGERPRDAARAGRRDAVARRAGQRDRCRRRRGRRSTGMKGRAGRPVGDRRRAAIAATASTPDQLDARSIGTGRMMLAGRAATARLVTNGAGAIDAGALRRGRPDACAATAPATTTAARALHRRRSTNTGLGQRDGRRHRRKCMVRAGAGGPVDVRRARALSWRSDQRQLRQLADQRGRHLAEPARRRRPDRPARRRPPDSASPDARAWAAPATSTSRDRGGSRRARPPPRRSPGSASARPAGA